MRREVKEQQQLYAFYPPSCFRFTGVTQLCGLLRPWNTARTRFSFVGAIVRSPEKDRMSAIADFNLTFISAKIESFPQMKMAEFTCSGTFLWDSRNVSVYQWQSLKRNELIHLSASLTKWSYTLKQFVRFCRRIVWVCLTILWGW